MEFEIKKGIPLPKKVGKPRKYDIDLDLMNKDEMVHIVLPKSKIQQEQMIIRNFVLRFVHKYPTKKFSVRTLDDGIGIWRTK